MEDLIRIFSAWNFMCQNIVHIDFTRIFLCNRFLFGCGDQNIILRNDWY